jgi:hypothetical protein
MVPQTLIDISSFTPATELSLYVDIEKTLFKLNYTDHLVGLDNSVGGESLTSNDIIANIRSVYTETLEDVLEQHGILLNEEETVPLRFMLALVDAILVLADGDIADIVASIDLEEADDLTILGTLITEVSELDLGDIYKYLSEVDSGLIKKIAASVVIEEDSSNSDYYKQRYLAYVGERRHGVVKDFISKRGTLPLDFIFSVTALKDKLSEITDIEELAFEYISLFNASDLNTEDFVSVGLKAIEDSTEVSLFIPLSNRITTYVRELTNGQ